MLTHKVLCRSVRTSDWFVTINLADGYFHIAIHPPHQKFVRFAYQGRSYKYKAITFGLSLSKCLEAALAPLRNSSIRIYYFLICSYSCEQAIENSTTLISHFRDLGFNINWAKSRVNPVQHTEYLGLNLNSLSYRVTLSEGRLKSLTQCLFLFQLGKCVTFRLCMRLLGIRAS